MKKYISPNGVKSEIINLGKLSRLKVFWENTSLKLRVQRIKTWGDRYIYIHMYIFYFFAFLFMLRLIVQVSPNVLSKDIN